jgi:hypothetical protein
MPNAIRPPRPAPPKSIVERLESVERDVAGLKAMATGRANGELTATQLANQAIAELGIIRAQAILDESKNMATIATKEDLELLEERIALRIKESVRPPSKSIAWAEDRAKKVWFGLLSVDQRETFVRRFMQGVSVVILALTGWIAARLQAAPHLVSPVSIEFNDAGAPALHDAGEQ